MKSKGADLVRKIPATLEFSNLFLLLGFFLICLDLFLLDFVFVPFFLGILNDQNHQFCIFYSSTGLLKPSTFPFLRQCLGWKHDLNIYFDH